MRGLTRAERDALVEMACPWYTVMTPAELSLMPSLIERGLVVVRFEAERGNCYYITDDGRLALRVCTIT